MQHFYGEEQLIYNLVRRNEATKRMYGGTSMTIAQMKEIKTELGFTNEMIAALSGIPLSTVQKIFSGITRAPRKRSLDAISSAIFKAMDEAGIRHDDMSGAGDGTRLQNGRSFQYDTPASGRSAGKVSEASYAYNTVPADGRHTIDDYYALPEDQRVELIDGVFYDMGAPAMVHQLILGELHLLFRACVDEHEMPCDVYLSPCDVRLDRDNYTMVQPDLLVICGEYDAGAIRYEGAPDLVVEILSPSTRMKDMILKLYKYQQAGVREYWIVDPRHKTVTVHCFESGEYDPVKYSFDDTIPIGLSDGKCSIDFSKIHQRMIKRGL